MKEKVVIYGLGKCWEENRGKIASDYEIVCCVDRDPHKAGSVKGYVFASPDDIKLYEYDKVLICSYSLGIREEIILQYDIPVDKIYYYIELYEMWYTYPEKDKYCQQRDLTVVIPTYNRKERLNRTLDLLERQTCKKFKIVILDNCSDYDIEKIIENREKDFKSKIVIRHNASNIGMQGNLALSFLQADDGWMWTLADDDIPSIYAIELIVQAIERNSSAGVIWFSIHNLWKSVGSDEIEIGDLKELTDLNEMIVQREKVDSQGDFIFFSNKVFHLKCIRDDLDKVFTERPLSPQQSWGE